MFLALANTLLSGRGVPSTPIVLNPLRVASQNNNYHTGELTISGGRTAAAYRWKHLYATEMRTLALAFPNWYMNTTSQFNASNSYTILSASIEAPNGVCVPLLFSGSPTKVVNAGDALVQSDEIPASAFGYTVTPAQSEFFIKYTIQVSAGQKIIFGSRRTGYTSGQNAIHYDPATTTLTSTSAAGQYSVVSGTAFTNVDYGLEAIPVGRPVVDGVTVIGVGDSILDGQTENVNRVWGGGYFRRSLMNVGTTLPVYNGITFAQPSARYFNPVFGNKWEAYIPYCTVGLDEMGVNDLDILSQVDIQNYGINVWNKFKAGGVRKVVRIKLGPESTSTDSWATTANQTVAARQASGSKGDLLNAFYDSKVADGTIDYAVNLVGLRDTVDPFKFAVNGTANYVTNDGLHLTPAGHELGAVTLRALWGSM